MNTEKKDTINTGVPEYDANTEYLQTVNLLFNKIACAGDSGSTATLHWLLNYYTGMLMARIINPEQRDQMREAREDVYLIELQKTETQRKGELLSVDDQRAARIEANTIIIGEMTTHFDRYFGFETKLEVML